jgi:hypothetical protein
MLKQPGSIYGMKNDSLGNLELWYNESIKYEESSNEKKTNEGILYRLFSDISLSDCALVA